MNYKGFNVKVKKSTYFNGNLRIDLIDDDNLPVATVSVNIKHIPLAADEIIVKDYSENEGMADFLQREGIGTRTRNHIVIGTTPCPIFKIK